MHFLFHQPCVRELQITVYLRRHQIVQCFFFLKQNVVHYLPSVLHLYADIELTFFFLLTWANRKESSETPYSLTQL